MVATSTGRLGWRFVAVAVVVSFAAGLIWPLFLPAGLLIFTGFAWYYPASKKSRWVVTALLLASIAVTLVAWPAGLYRT